MNGYVWVVKGIGNLTGALSNVTMINRPRKIRAYVCACAGVSRSLSRSLSLSLSLSLCVCLCVCVCVEVRPSKPTQEQYNRNPPSGLFEQQQQMAMPGVVAPLHRWPRVRREPRLRLLDRLPRLGRRHVPGLPRASADGGLDPSEAHRRHRRGRSHPVSGQPHLGLIRQTHFLGVRSSFYQRDVNCVSSFNLSMLLAFLLFFFFFLFPLVFYGFFVFAHRTPREPTSKLPIDPRLCSIVFPLHAFCDRVRS
jgi:hypothetical protein